jgi:hypothetical protein
LINYYNENDPKAARMGRLRGYGNAIVPQVAAEFVRATTDSGHGC